MGRVGGIIGKKNVKFSDQSHVTEYRKGKGKGRGEKGRGEKGKGEKGREERYGITFLSFNFK